MNELIDVNQVMRMLAVRKSTAYRLIREINAELQAKGVKTVRGKVSRAHLERAYFGDESQCQ